MLSNRGERDSLSYFKVLPYSDYELDEEAWVENPFFLRLDPVRTGGFLKGSGFFRFLAVVDDEIVSLYLACPPGRERSLEAAVRGSCPKVALVRHEGNPLSDFFDVEKTAAITFKAVSPTAPFNCDNSFSEFRSALEAFGVGRRDDVRGVLDVCFEPDPSYTTKLAKRLAREIMEMSGVRSGGLSELLGGADLGMSAEAIVAALMGEKRAARVQRRTPAVVPVEDKKRTSAYEQRLVSVQRGVFRVFLRVAVCSPSPRLTLSVISAVGSSLQSLSWYNKLVWTRGGRFLVRGIVEGRVGLLDPSFYMTGRELSQLVVFPGQESDRLWLALEKATSRTIPPPSWLLGGGDEEV